MLRNLGNIRIAGKIDLQQGVEEALRNLSLTGGFSCMKQSDAYILYSQNSDRY